MTERARAVEAYLVAAARMGDARALSDLVGVGRVCLRMQDACRMMPRRRAISCRRPGSRYCAGCADCRMIMRFCPGRCGS